MKNSRFKNSGRTNRITALFFTLLVHTALLGGLIYGSNSDAPMSDLLPDVVKEWLDDGKQQEDNKDKKQREGA